MIKKHEKYQEEISRLRKERNETRAKNSFVIKTTEEILNTFNFDGFQDLITFDEMYNLEINKVYDVNEGVSFLMIHRSKDKLVFETYMQEGGSFGIQSHDCFEVCEIIQGNLIEVERTYKVYKQGELVSYAPFEKHKPYASKDSIYRVTFLKNIIDNEID